MAQLRHRDAEVGSGAGSPDLARLESSARPFYDHDDPGHDWTHIERVSRLCGQIGRQVGADPEVLLPAALLHDVVNRRKDEPSRAQASHEAATVAMPLLAAAGYTRSDAERIAIVIIEHSYTLGQRPSSLEAAVLQDSDRLDALGAIGVLRAATCGARLGAAYYDEADPFARRRSLDDRRYTIDHFYTKLLRLPETLNTDAARREGMRRVAVMRAFLSELGTELCVEPPEVGGAPNLVVLGHGP